MKTLLQGIKWGNFLTIIAQLIGMITGAFPETKWTPYLLALQGVLQAFMTSMGGFAHKASFGEGQAPEDRTAHEVVASAVVTSAALKAATAEGTSVTVPTMGTAIAVGSKP